MPEIKICGITRPEETDYLNEAGVEYAGFVFYEKSRRNVTLAKAKELMRRLDERIQKVAVTVAPDKEQIRQLVEAGFDILQVHGTIMKNELTACKIPIWRAVNISGLKEAAEQLAKEQALEPLYTGYVADGMTYGGGKTFSWKETENDSVILQKLRQKTFILAGGLQSENVAEGIRIFHPDVVDVSSGVEGADGKSKEKIKTFVREVRRHE